MEDIFFRGICTLNFLAGGKDIRFQIIKSLSVSGALWWTQVSSPVIIELRKVLVLTLILRSSSVHYFHHWSVAGGSKTPVHAATCGPLSAVLATIGLQLFWNVTCLLFYEQMISKSQVYWKVQGLSAACPQEAVPQQAWRFLWRRRRWPTATFHTIHIWSPLINSLIQ